MIKQRDAIRTREAILAAAAREFGAKGYAGARMEGIARAAGVKKELLYHYFKGKEHLFEEVRDSRIEDGLRREPGLPANPVDIIPTRFSKLVADIEWVKFLTWEAAQGNERQLPLHKERRRNIFRYIEAIKREQQAGRLPRDLDPRLLQLAIFALTTYPLAFSQITRLATGRSAHDKEFQREWAVFLKRLSKRIIDPKRSKNSPLKKNAKREANRG